MQSDEVENIFDRLGFVVSKTDEEAWEVTAPFERPDINIEADVIEEIGRVYGYDKVTSVVPETVSLDEYNQRHYYSEQVRDILTDLGFSEVITSSFRKKDKVQLQNALASDKSYMRSSLIKNVTEALDRNAGLTDLLGATDTRIFEVGTVFTKADEGIAEHVSICFGVRLKPSGYTGKEDKALNQILENLEGKLGVKVNAVVEKGVAEINFSEVLEGLPKVSTYKPVEVADEIIYKPFSQYPSMSRDVALWVTEGTASAEVETVLNENAGELRVRTTLFDEFSKDGRTSFAFRIVFQSFKKTLTDEEVNTVMDKVYQAVAEKSWEVR